jgi:hypothetical protein
MVILRVTSILGGQKEDKGMMCSITQPHYAQKFHKPRVFGEMPQPRANPLDTIHLF